MVLSSHAGLGYGENKSWGGGCTMISNSINFSQLTLYKKGKISHRVVIKYLMKLIIFLNREDHLQNLQLFTGNKTVKQHFCRKWGKTDFLGFYLG